MQLLLGMEQYCVRLESVYLSRLFRNLARNSLTRIKILTHEFLHRRLLAPPRSLYIRKMAYRFELGLSECILGVQCNASLSATSSD